LYQPGARGSIRLRALKADTTSFKAESLKRGSLRLSALKAAVYFALG